MKKTEVSVIVAIYNPVWEKLKNTLRSILMQQDVEYEIIIVDDGSKNNTSNQVEEFLVKNNFHKYILDYASENQGTCANVIRGINRANGQYVKLISPGDYLYSPDALYSWYKYNLNNDCKISFGDAIYYNLDKENEPSIIYKENAPINLNVYIKEAGLNMLKENCLLLHDFPVGAAFMVDTELMREYCELIEGKVKYAEDMIYRIMLADNIRIHYFQKPVVWYEYGEGVSTNKENKWQKILQKDLDMATDIIYGRIKCVNSFSKRYKFYLKSNTKTKKILKYLLFPRVLIWKLNSEFRPTMTPQNANMNYYEHITKGDSICK